MKRFLKTLVIVLSIFMIGFPVSGKSIVKTYVTKENVIKIVYVATNMEVIAKREINKCALEVYSLISETIFGEP